MKLFATFVAKSKSIYRKSKHLKKAKLIKRFQYLATVFLMCGIFYSLLINLLDEDSNKAIAKKDKQTQISSVEKMICNETTSSISISNKQLESFKKESLCGEFPIENNKNTLEKEQKEQQEEKQEKFRKELDEVIKETPMGVMTKSISKQDRKVAALLVGIAFKESKFGVHSPSKNGQHCYNYWGFKGKTNPTAGGYACFASPEEAVQIVGQRIEKLVKVNNLNTPSKMIVWKCGSSCAGHSPESVQKWIADVSIYFNPLSRS